VLPSTPSTSVLITIFDEGILVIVHSCTDEIRCGSSGRTADWKRRGGL
jgi:hypothetical protein